MSFVVAAPDAVSTVAQDLAGIHSSLSQATAAATGPTTAIVAAAEDEVSAAVAALFGAFGEEYHAVGAQAAAFHEQFVGALNGAASAYHGAETVNAKLAATADGTVGPYRSLVRHTLANLHMLGGAITANPAPFLRQTLINTTGYVNTIAAELEYVLQNFPAVVAGTPAGIEAGLQGLLAFNPGTYLQQLITNQLTYADIWVSSLRNAFHDFLIGLQGLPTAFQSAWQQLLAGNIGGALGDVIRGFLNLFVTGADVTSTGAIPGVQSFNVGPSGSVADLTPILGIPGVRAQNLTNWLPPGSIAAQIAQHATNVINTVTDLAFTETVALYLRNVGLQVFVVYNNDVTLGLPVALAVDALGAPYNGLVATSTVASQFVSQLGTGNPIGALGTLIDSPAVITDAFLNGQSTLPISISYGTPPVRPYYTGVVDFPMDGLLVPETGYTSTITYGIPFFYATITVPVTGTPISGLVPGLLVYAPEQLAAAITG